VRTPHPITQSNKGGNKQCKRTACTPRPASKSTSVETNNAKELKWRLKG